MKNRNPIKRFFVTFPQWHNSSKSQIMLEHKELDIQNYLICKEKHEDEKDHYHLLYILDKPRSWKTIVKWYQTKYNNDYKRIKVEAVKSMRHAINYIKKDGDFEGDIRENACSQIMQICKDEYRAFKKYYMSGESFYWCCKDFLELYKPSFRAKFISSKGQLAHQDFCEKHRQDCKNCQM